MYGSKEKLKRSRDQSGYNKLVLDGKVETQRQYLDEYQTKVKNVKQQRQIASRA